MPEISVAERSRRKRKKIILIIVITVITVLAVLSWFFTREKPAEKATPYTADVYDPFDFALDDPDAPSIFDDEDYLALDRTLHIKRGMEEYTVTDASSELADDAARFFLGYFDALSHGDASRYGEMFTDEYYSKYLRQDDFSEQRVYDIHLTWLESSPDGQSVYYLVEYKISRNNGSFRRDIASDASRPVVFGLVLTESGYKVNDVHYLTS